MGRALSAGSLHSRTWPNPPTGTEECERALEDFVAFQNVSFRRLLQLQQALSGLGAWTPHQPWQDRLSLQQTLWRQLMKLHKA